MADDKYKYAGDVLYDVWRSGGDPNRIDYDRIDEHWRDHDPVETAVADELRHQRNPDAAVREGLVDGTEPHLSAERDQRGTEE